MNDIDECPFCGGTVDPQGWLRGDGKRGPECNDCGATAPSMEAWNKRVPQEKSEACFNAVISYVLANPCESPLEFLHCWNEGDFDSIRREWPDAPSDVFLADSLNEGNDSEH